ncbi:MAG: C25 family cysteine peptidase, partial [Bacteroidales bacterium]
SNPAVGKTTTAIQNYLQGLYNAGTASDPAPSFVLLVGDINLIPSFAGTTGSHVSDLYYCEYTGDDFPEMYYGRFDAATVADLQPQIDKTLEYEQYTMPDPSFLANCDMISGQDESGGVYSLLYGDGQVNYGDSTYFNTAHGLNCHSYPYAISGTSAAQIIQDVSNGVCYANYSAHGSSDGWYDPAFTISEVAGLQNNHKYPLMVGNCCLTNEFNQPMCFGVALLRASGKGAVGYIGGSDETLWDEDFWWGVGYKTAVAEPTYNANCLGAYDGTFHDHGESFGEWYSTMDQMVFAGDLAVTQSGSSNTLYYWEVYHLMGDPSLMIYFGVPPALTATYSPLIPLGYSSFTVNTEPYAYVAVSMNGVLHGAVLADSMGVAVVPITPFTVAGTADVVATKQNRAPFIGSVPVESPSGPYMVYIGKALHDTGGNNNGLADFGENIKLDITLQNVGLATANGVSAILRTNDTLVTITDSTQSWGTVASGDSSIQSSAYAFTVHNIIPDQHVVPFILHITNNVSNTWTGNFNIVLNAPKLIIGTIIVNDTSGGYIDPGENFNLIVLCKNIGHSDAINATSQLSLNSGSVTINTPIDNIGTLHAGGGSANATFSVSVSSAAVSGSEISFRDSLYSGNYFAHKPINLMIGVADEDWETATFTKFPWVQGGNLPWVISDTSPFQGTYCAKSGHITDSQESDLGISFYVLTDDSISFYRKVSSEATFDILYFYIDNVVKDTASGFGGGWKRVSVPVTAGTHTFKWSYQKDYSNSVGSDCAWLDFILFPPVQLAPFAVNNLAGNETTLICYPNPFSKSTSIAYSLEKSGKANIDVYNSIGQLVATLVNGDMEQAGSHTMAFNAKGLRAGIYHCVLTTDEKTVVYKLLILE